MIRFTALALAFLITVAALPSFAVPVGNAAPDFALKY